MTTVQALPKLERLAALVESVSGIVFSAGQLVHLRELMARRAAHLGMTDLPAYVLALEQGRLEEEWRVLLPAITVKESYLFRIPEQFHALQERLLPELLRARSGGELRAWSAGCAHGEEPATLAVVLAEAGLPLASWSILATDVDERALAEAAHGVFSQRAVSQVPAPMLERYFAPRAAGWELDPELMRRIRFERLNLVREPFPQLGPAFDLVLLRNVLIYFRPESQRRVVDGVASNLAPDGYLFLGHSESLWQLSARLAPVDLGGCFAYRHAGPVVAAAAAPAATAPAGHRAATSRRRRAAVAMAEPAPRRGAGHGSVAPPPAPAPVTPPPSPAPGRSGTIPALATAVDALAEGRLLDALELVSRRVAAAPDDAAGQALLGLAKDLAGDGDGALAAYRAALFLRPALYRVRFQLAERLRQAGWRDRARTEYRSVLASLEAAGEELPELVRLLPGTAVEIAARCRAALAR